MCYEPAVRYLIRPVASRQELARALDLMGAQRPQRLTITTGASATWPAASPQTAP